MAIDNVVPIDAQTARVLQQRKVHFRWFVAAVTGTWLAVLVPVLAFTPLPPLVPFVVFALLVILAEHQFVLFGDETSMSASIIVVVASIFVFADSAPLAGPMLIASLGGLYLPHLRNRARALVLANAAIFSLAASIAAALATGFNPGGGGSTVGATTAAVAATAAYWYANSVLIGVASAMRNGSGLAQSVRIQALSEWPVLLLASTAALVAQADHHALPLTATAVAALLMIFHVHMRRRGRPEPGSSPLTVGTTALIIGLVSLLFSSAAVGNAVACTGMFYVVSRLSSSGSRWTRDLAPILCMTVATILAIGLAAFGVSALIRFGASTALAIALFTALDARRLITFADRRLPLLAAVGVAIPNRNELVALCSVFISISATIASLDGAARCVAAFVAVTLLWSWQANRANSSKAIPGPVSFPETSVGASH